MRKHTGKAQDLGYGHMGNGIVVWDRTREKHGDYLNVAHISRDRVIEWYAPLSDEQIADIVKNAEESDPQISQTQDTKVFSTRPTIKNQIQEEIDKLEERKDMAVYQRKITTQLCTAIEYDQEIGAIDRRLEQLQYRIKKVKYTPMETGKWNPDFNKLSFG